MAGMEARADAMAAFFEAAVEAGVNRAFIGRSAWCRQARAMTPTTPPALRLARRSAAAAIAAMLVAAGLSVARAGDDEKDHERVRAAVRAGQVKPFEVLRERLAKSHPGELLDLELEREHGHWIYEVKLLQPDGRIVKLEVDARSGEVLKERRGERRR